MTNLATNPDFQIFSEYLNRSLEEETKTCIYSDSPDARGRAQIITELKETLSEARNSAISRVAKRAIRKEGSNAF